MNVVYRSTQVLVRKARPRFAEEKCNKGGHASCHRDITSCCSFLKRSPTFLPQKNNEIKQNNLKSDHNVWHVGKGDGIANGQLQQPPEPPQQQPAQESVAVLYDYCPPFSLHKCTRRLTVSTSTSTYTVPASVASPNKSIISMESYMTFIPEVLF